MLKAPICKKLIKSSNIGELLLQVNSEFEFFQEEENGNASENGAQGVDIENKISGKNGRNHLNGQRFLFFDNHVAHVPDHVGNQGGHAGFHSL